MASSYYELLVLTLRICRFSICAIPIVWIFVCVIWLRCELRLEGGLAVPYRCFWSSERRSLLTRGWERSSHRYAILSPVYSSWTYWFDRCCHDFPEEVFEVFWPNIGFAVVTERNVWDGQTTTFDEPDAH